MTDRVEMEVAFVSEGKKYATKRYSLKHTTKFASFVDKLHGVVREHLKHDMKTSRPFHAFSYQHGDQAVCLSTSQHWELALKRFKALRETNSSALHQLTVETHCITMDQRGQDALDHATWRMTHGINAVQRVRSERKTKQAAEKKTSLPLVITTSPAE